MKDCGDAALHEWDCECADCTQCRGGKPPGTPACMRGEEPSGYRCGCPHCSSLRTLAAQGLFAHDVDWEAEEALVTVVLSEDVK